MKAMNEKILSLVLILLFISASISTASTIEVTDFDTKNEPVFLIEMIDYESNKDINDKVKFEVKIVDLENNPVYFTNYNIFTSPNEEIEIQNNKNTITGEFIPTREGIYSLTVEVSIDETSTIQRFYYIINGESDTVKYYFRDINPTHGQPGDGKGEDGDHGDQKALILEPPQDGMEYWKCSRWVQSSPDEIPKNMPFFSILKSVDTHFWYQVEEFLYRAISRMGIQRFATRGTFVNRFKRIKPTERGEKENPDDYTWTNKKISYLNWPMISEKSWYFLSIKVAGDYPYLMTIPNQPSYAELSYLYYDKIDIKLSSNPSIKILSATTDSENPNEAKIILEGRGKTDLKIKMHDKSIDYNAKINNENCEITQKNGEIFFDDLHLYGKNSENTISISKDDGKSINKDFMISKIFRIINRLYQKLILLKN